MQKLSQLVLCDLVWVMVQANRVQSGTMGQEGNSHVELPTAPHEKDGSA